MDVSPKDEGAGASGSIEEHVIAIPKESNAREITEAAFPAGMKPTGVVRHGRQPER